MWAILTVNEGLFKIRRLIGMETAKVDVQTVVLESVIAFPTKKYIS
jgi:hypothetical protein